MPTPPDAFDEFFRKVAPLMPLYKSLEFACVAARHGSEWILVSGKALLSTEPCASEAQIVPVAQLQEFVALQGRIPAEGVNEVVANLRDFWVVRNLNGINVGLTAEGAGGYSWKPPYIIEGRSGWYREFAVNGNGPGTSSLLSPSALREIDSQLCRSMPVYLGFDMFCRRLGLYVRPSDPTSSFRVSAVLPAQVSYVIYGICKPWSEALNIAIQSRGEPLLILLR
jgi:hypothetical protein